MSLSSRHFHHLDDKSDDEEEHGHSKLADIEAVIDNRVINFDFDLYLLKYNMDTEHWEIVAESISYTAQESINYFGEPACYSFQVVSHCKLRGGAFARFDMK